MNNFNNTYNINDEKQNMNKKYKLIAQISKKSVKFEYYVQNEIVWYDLTGLYIDKIYYPIYAWMIIHVINCMYHVLTNKIM